MIKYSNQGISTIMAMVVSAVLVCGGVFAYQYYSSKKVVDTPPVKNDYVKIAKTLAQGYLEGYLFEDVVLSKRIKSYSINGIDIDVLKDNCFGFKVDLSVEIFKSESDWTAGNGKIEGNWVMNKNIFMNAFVNNNGYVLKIVGTERVDDDCTNGSPITVIEVVK